MAEYCTRHKGGVARVYFITANQSIPWGAVDPEDDIGVMPEPQRIEAVCAACLTREEIAKLLAPSALFCLRNIAGGRFQYGGAAAALNYLVSPAVNAEAAARELLGRK